VRIPFLIDPFAGWLVPTPVVHAFFTMHAPLSGAGSIIVILYWHELVSSQSIDVSGFLTSSRIPAAIIIVILVLIEAITASFRASGNAPNIIIILNAFVPTRTFSCRFFSPVIASLTPNSHLQDYLCCVDYLACGLLPLRGHQSARFLREAPQSPQHAATPS
jgi:hypothetical protein